MTPTIGEINAEIRARLLKKITDERELTLSKLEHLRGRPMEERRPRMLKTLDRLRPAADRELGNDAGHGAQATSACPDETPMT